LDDETGPVNLHGGPALHRTVFAAAFAVAALFSVSAFESIALAAPIPGPAQIINDTASPVVQVDRRCGPHRHYVPRHRVRGHDGRSHWVGGVCVRN
jgi:hypothetical protein